MREGRRDNGWGVQGRGTTDERGDKEGTKGHRDQEAISFQHSAVRERITSDEQRAASKKGGWGRTVVYTTMETKHGGVFGEGWFGLPTKMPGDISKGRVLELMGSEKKARGGRVRFVLLEGEIECPLFPAQLGVLK